MGVMIQPLQAFTYMVFMLIAAKIMNVAPLLAILFINYLGKADRIVRSLFRIENGIVTKGMNEAGGKIKELSGKIKV